MATCDICRKNHATRSVTRIHNGVRETTNICASCANKQSGRESEANSGGQFGDLNDIFGNIFGDIFGNIGNQGNGGSGQILPGQMRQRQQESVGFKDYLSNSGETTLEQALNFARQYNHQVVDTEHLLLALLENEIVQKILDQLKINSQTIKKQIEGELHKERQEPDHLEYSPRMKRIFDLSLDEARAMFHNYIGPEHLLLALVREGEGTAAQILKKNGLELTLLRQRVTKIVGKGEESEQLIAMNTPNIDKYSRDLTDLARRGKLDPVIGRSKEIETAIEVLSRRTKNNPVLIGEAGVGKTAIVEGLAQRIVSGSIPESLYGKRVAELNIASLLAGTRFRGDLEERLKQVIDEIVDNSKSLIVFIDEIHLIVGAGNTGEGGMDAANIFKPALARGELNIIGATTLNEYKKYIEKDQALERRFQPIVVAEPSPQEALQILRGLRDRYESHHRVKVSDEALQAAVSLSDRYITARFLPDKAIDLLDQSAARVRIQSTTEPEGVRNFEEKITDLKKEQEALARSKKSKEVEAVKKEILKLEKDRDKAFDDWQETRGRAIPTVERKNIAEIVSRLTGIPVADLTEAEKDKLLNLEGKLRERVIGQEEALKSTAAAIRRSRAGLSDPHRPIASFIFLGPTGVGKTELAKSLARVMFGEEDAMVRIDMSEYLERHSVARLIGAPPGYVGFEEGGQLTEAIRRRPHSIILLDEIEKAHPDIFNILLQVLDDGRLTDGQGRSIDFTNTIIIATSNIGFEIIQHELDQPEKKQLSYESLREKLMEEVKKHFRPEFLNRLDELIVFRALSQEQIKSIVKIQLADLQKRLNNSGLDLTITAAAIEQVAKDGYDPHFGARELRRIIQQSIENKISELILSGGEMRGKIVNVDYQDGKFIVSLGEGNKKKIIA